jgi:Listeria-Bacteroides repeat domain (List_Bact_rpt)
MEWNDVVSAGNGNEQLVFALAVSGADVYVGGEFTTAGGVSANYIAKWNGTTWSALGSGMNGIVEAIAITGTDVYVGGRFTTSGGVTTNRIAKWDGMAWSVLGSGMDSFVFDLAISGPDVYVGGWFTTAGGIAASRMAKWNGTTWSAMGTGMNSPVEAVIVSGTDVYAGGHFTIAGGVPASHIAKWNGTAWSALNTGLNGNVQSLAVSGSDIYASGSFSNADGISANNMAMWNGTTWSALGSGVNDTALALAVSGNDIYVGGEFTIAGNKASAFLARLAAPLSVIYHANGATGGTVPASQLKLQDVTLSLASNAGSLVKTGSTFSGWNTAADGSGTSYAEGASYSANASATLYAKWTPITFTVTYNANGATGGAVPTAQTKTHSVDLILASNSGSLVKTGSTFSGWNTAANGSGIAYAAGATYIANAAMTLYAQWTNTYAVTYAANGSTGGTVPAAQTKTFGVDLTLASNTGSLVKTGSTFSGWNTAANGSGTAYAEGATYAVNATVTLYAQWTLNTYAVTYNANGATGGTAPVAQIKSYGVDLTLASNSGSLVKTGLAFAGWNTTADGSGTTYLAAASYTANAPVTLFAQWATTYDVTYNANGATSGAIPAAQLKVHGLNLTLAGNSGSLAKTNYTFAGWNTVADGSGTTYAAGATYSANAAVTLYAQWANTYAVIYDGNGATGGTVPAAQVKNFGVDLTLAINSGSLVKSDSTYSGWNTAADGSGTTYAVGATYSANAAVTLYAQWQVIGGVGDSGGSGGGGGGGCGLGSGLGALGMLLMMAWRLKLVRRTSFPPREF